MIFSVTTTKEYRKAFSRLLYSGRHNDLEKVKDCVSLLENDTVLPAHYKNHNLVGEYAGISECHIKFDLLLMYKINRGTALITLINLGSHPELFD